MKPKIAPIELVLPGHSIAVSRCRYGHLSKTDTRVVGRHLAMSQNLKPGFLEQANRSPQQQLILKYPAAERDDRQSTRGPDRTACFDDHPRNRVVKSRGDDLNRSSGAQIVDHGAHQD